MPIKALKYLVRNYKRSIILSILLFTISFSVTLGLGVWRNIGVVTKEVQQTFGSSFNLRIPSFIKADSAYYRDVTASDGTVSKAYIGPRVNDEIAQKVIKTGKVKVYNAENETFVYLNKYSLYLGRFRNALNFRLNGLDDPEDELGPGVRRMRIGTTQICGNTDTSLYNKFRSGAFVLKEGRHIQPNDRDKVLVSDELASLNRLKIGDIIAVDFRFGITGHTENPMEIQGEARTLEIVGIFHVNGYQPTGRFAAEVDITYNWLFTDTETVKYFQMMEYETLSNDFTPEPQYSNITFFVDNPSELETAIKEVKALDTFDVSSYDISVDDTMYKSTVDPLNTIRNLVVGLVIVIVISCIAVLCIVFTMWVSRRRKEVAIYLSLGISKASIIGQFILEASIIAFMAGILAFGACQKVPDAVGNHMLAAVVERSQPQEKEYTREEIHEAAQTGKMSELYHYEYSSYAGPEHIDFQFHFTDFLILLLSELLIIIGAVCKGSSYIFKLQPRQIMSDFR